MIRSWRAETPHERESPAFPGNNLPGLRRQVPSKRSKVMIVKVRVQEAQDVKLSGVQIRTLRLLSLRPLGVAAGGLNTSAHRRSKPGSKTLVGMGLVSALRDREGVYLYRITAKGRKALNSL